MPDDINDALAIMIERLDAHGTGLGSVIGSASNRLASEIQKLQSAVWQVTQALKPTPSLSEFQLRLELLASSFQRCTEICNRAVAEGIALRDEDFEVVVNAWYKCRGNVYSDVATAAEYLMEIVPFIKGHIDNLKEYELRIEDEINRHGRLDLI